MLLSNKNHTLFRLFTLCVYLFNNDVFSQTHVGGNFAETLQAVTIKGKQTINEKNNKTSFNA